MTNPNQQEKRSEALPDLNASSEYWRCVMALPISGSMVEMVTVHLHATKDGDETYAVRDIDGGRVRTFTTPERAFSKAFVIAGWPVITAVPNPPKEA